MIIFYPSTPEGIVNPVVILDALDSSDRYTDLQVLAQVYKNFKADNAQAISSPSIYSCSYEFEFTHNGIPLGEGIKTQFLGTISSPPASLVSQFSPKFFTSAQSIDQMADVASKIANPRTTITNAALVVRDQKNNYVSRQFVAYTAQIQPDVFGATTTMVIHGAALDDILIKSEIAFQLDKKFPLSTQLTTMLTGAGYVPIFNMGDANANGVFQTIYPTSDKLFQPMKLRELLDEVCLQNKLVYHIDDKVVNFYSQTDKPTLYEKAEFSFLGYKGSLAWAIGVENYANIKFKTPYFDARLFQPITIWNDIKTAFFDGLVKNGNISLINSYDANIIRYTLRRTQDEIVAEVTATNNWLLSQMRIDGILEAKIYAGAL
jgi:hypothetical protein